MLNTFAFEANEKIFIIGEIQKQTENEIALWQKNSNYNITRSAECSLPDSYFFPFDDQSLDKILVLNEIPKIRMDQLYMLISESRRCLKNRGILFICNPTTGLNILIDFLQTKILRKRLLKIHHYFTPEDWKELNYSIKRTGCFTQETILLQKI